MNEFIEWDEEKQKFQEPLGSCFLNINEWFSTYKRYEKPSRFTIHQYIGKTDDTPEQNKIYADSSIVEFNYVDKLQPTTDDKSNNKTIRGYFKYCNESLRYYIIDLKAKETIYFWTGYTEKNLKVIGTLQENKELL